GSAWPNTISHQVQVKDAPVASGSAPVVDAAPAMDAAPAAPAILVAKKPEPAAGSGHQGLAESWVSPAPRPWVPELKKASELATGWDPPKGDAQPSAYAAETTVKDETAEQPAAETVTEEAGLPSSAIEAIRGEAAQVAEAAPVSGVTGVAAEPKMDELVAKVL